MAEWFRGPGGDGGSWARSWWGRGWPWRWQEREGEEGDRRRHGRVSSELHVIVAAEEAIGQVGAGARTTMAVTGGGGEEGCPIAGTVGLIRAPCMAATAVAEAVGAGARTMMAMARGGREAAADTVGSHQSMYLYIYIRYMYIYQILTKVKNNFPIPWV